MPRRATNGLKPTVSGLEPRWMPVIRGGYAPPPDVMALAQAHAAQVVSQVPAPTAPPPPIIPGPGQPLPIELARSRFAANFLGSVRYGRPLYMGESGTMNFNGWGSSNHFLHGNYQMAIILPKSPTGPITGAAFLEDKNLTAGNATGLDINFDPTSLDRFGRPTQGSWATDPNIYSGSFFYNNGSGTLRIRYFPGGRAAAFFSGHIYTNGITNVLGVF